MKKMKEHIFISLFIYSNREDAEEIPERGCEPDKDVVLSFYFLYQNMEVDAYLQEKPYPEEDFQDKSSPIFIG